MKLEEILDVRVLGEMLAEGYVREQKHWLPGVQLTIYNYTHQAAYDGMWNDVTEQCRGLIVDRHTGEVVARPFRKFYNVGQSEAPELTLDEPVVVTDKLDGSLGILYPMLDVYGIATRGSFTSEQATHATALLQKKYSDFLPVPGVTYLFEIIYPENRIVIDYGGEDDLILLTCLDNTTGDPPRLFREAMNRWPGKYKESPKYRTFGEALAAPPRANAEGYVIYLPLRKQRVKLKQEDYIELHRIVTGLNARVVWKHLVDDTLLEFIDQVPDEFHEWVKEIALTLSNKILLMCLDYAQEYLSVTKELGSSFTRKEFALRVQNSPNRWALFMILDGKKVEPEAWKLVKPAPNITPSSRIFTEDTA